MIFGRIEIFDNLRENYLGMYRLIFKNTKTMIASMSIVFTVKFNH